MGRTRKAPLLGKREILSISSKKPTTYKEYYERGALFAYFGKEPYEQAITDVPDGILKKLKVADSFAVISMCKPSALDFSSENVQQKQYLSYWKDRSKLFMHTFTVIKKYGYVAGYDKPGVLLKSRNFSKHLFFLCHTGLMVFSTFDLPGPKTQSAHVKYKTYATRPKIGKLEEDRYAEMFTCDRYSDAMFLIR